MNNLNKQYWWLGMFTSMTIVVGIMTFMFGVSLLENRFEYLGIFIGSAIGFILCYIAWKMELRQIRRMEEGS